jgi:hypothetical protein
VVSAAPGALPSQLAALDLTLTLEPYQLFRRVNQFSMTQQQIDQSVKVVDPSDANTCQQL